ncbi:hypothetical protein [Providencia huaxiensis]|uniref:phage tail fiber protein n=1 Tax=Providencia huaxiensis TaxID=2027290 RepID=UPI002FE01F9B
MYNTGTVTTTADSTKLIGTGTKWLNNINRVSAEQAIQIQIGTAVHNNSIQSIQSDTELTLNFPLPTAATGAKYVILTTMVHSVSDAMNKIVSMNVSNVQFSDILTRWMTEQGIITVTLPDQTTQQLRTTKEMDKQLDGKFDKAGGTATGAVMAANEVGAKTNNAHISLITSDKTRGPHIASRKEGETNYLKHNLPSQSGTLMQIGDNGWAGSGVYRNVDDAGFIDIIKENKSQIIRSNIGNTYQTPYGTTALFITGDSFGSLCFQHTSGVITATAGYQSGALTYKNVLYGTANTTKDSNGNLKVASPVIKVFADHIELNDESEGVELEKLGTGRYKLKGTLGMHSDASWGGIHGGLVVPNGINNLPLVWADFDVLPDGDIVIETRYRKHALHPMLEAQRLMTYPEFLDENNEEREDYDYCDIPNGHWIDVRVNMPSNSIYNQKQAEAERLAKIEAERLAQEEEVEKAEQEGQSEA